jgi:protein tyrosine phosphatase (PTP) superfamily phosphohydrolase (DUF442 family)
MRVRAGLTEGEQMDRKEKKKIKSTRRRYLVIVLSFLAVLVAACLVQTCGVDLGAPFANRQRQVQAERASGRKWAQPLSLPGVPNLYKVSDELYRGAQPSAEGMKQLEKLGVKTDLNLRFIVSDRSKLKGTGLTCEHINMVAFHPETEQVARFLRIVTDPRRTPLFVHCREGADRTGMMCAVYRIAVQGWSKDQAIEEMTKGGFSFHCIWQNLASFIRKLDIDKIKRAAGMAE